MSHMHTCSWGTTLAEQDTSLFALLLVMISSNRACCACSAAPGPEYTSYEYLDLSTDAQQLGASSRFRDMFVSGAYKSCSHHGTTTTQYTETKTRTYIHTANLVLWHANMRVRVVAVRVMVIGVRIRESPIGVGLQ